jgi:hypothetical protein
MTAKVMCKRADSRHHAMMSVHLLFATVPFRFRKVQLEPALRMKLLAQFMRQAGRAQQSAVTAKVNNGELHVQVKCLYGYCMDRTGRRWVGLLLTETVLDPGVSSLVMQAYPPPNALKSQTYHLTLTLTSTYHTTKHSLSPIPLILTPKRQINSTDGPRCSTLPASHED